MCGHAVSFSTGANLVHLIPCLQKKSVLENLPWDEADEVGQAAFQALPYSFVTHWEIQSLEEYTEKAWSER